MLHGQQERQEAFLTMRCVAGGIVHVCSVTQCSFIQDSWFCLDDKYINACGLNLKQAMCLVCMKIFTGCAGVCGASAVLL